MATDVSYTLPIYEAVVCNLTLQNIRQKEVEQEMILSKTLESVALSKEALKTIGGGDFSSTSPETIVQTSVGLCVLIDSCRSVISWLRELLPGISEKYQSALATAVSNLEANTERFEEISEAWSMASDETTVAAIKKALSGSKKNAEKVIPDWREALATLSH